MKKIVRRRSHNQKTVNENIMGNLKRFLAKSRSSLKRLNNLQKQDILGKERPQTGFGNRMQGIDPWRSGELRQNIPFYDTPVGSLMGRRAMVYQGTARVPPSSLPEGKVYSQLQEMVNKSIATREINNVLVTQDMAKNIVQLHEALNTKNKKLLEESIQTKDGFFEVLDFSVRN